MSLRTSSRSELSDRMKPNIRLVDACAQAFLEKFGEDCRHRLPEIASELGLEIEEVEADSYDGALLRLPGAHIGTIVINSRIRSAARRRFTLCHELAHYILPNQSDLASPCVADYIERWRNSESQAAETEANRFAAEILMPLSHIAEHLAASPSFQAIRSIADACAVSLTAAAFRLAEFTSHRVAIVWSRDGKVMWYSSSTEFRRAVLRGALDERTYAHDVFRGEQVPDRFEQVPATAWLYETNLRGGATILEHSVRLPSYDAALSLLMIPDQIELRTEYEDSQADDISLDPEEFTLRRTRWPSKR